MLQLSCNIQVLTYHNSKFIRVYMTQLNKNLVNSSFVYVIIYFVSDWTIAQPSNSHWHGL